MAEVEVSPADIKRTILFRQIAFLIGLAASVAVGVYVVLWSQTPNYSLLYGSLSSQDVGPVLEALKKVNIEYRVDESSGAVMVPSSKVYDARMKLAAESLPRGGNIGFGILQEEQKIGTSQFMERARYQYALEGELAKSIEQISTVRSARVHLAIPKQSLFIRNRKSASASVILDLFSGHKLDPDQVAAIANLVAASVPHLDMKQVSIIDQFGHLMTRDSGSSELVISNKQFEYAQRVEQSYIRRIEDILIPIVGQDGVKAQVSAEFDFISTEQTRESYDPDLSALRSEQIEEDQLTGTIQDGGIPGALSNQPPADASVPESLDAVRTVARTNAQNNTSMQKRATRNYELDKTISHTRMPVGTLRRMSVAVLLDYKRTLDDSGNISYVEHSPEELEQITSLVKEAIGYNVLRGDAINVMNAEFTRPGPIEALPNTPLWKQPWLWDIVKQVLGALFIILLVFGVLRPILKKLADKEIILHQSLLTSQSAAAGLTGPDQQAEELDKRLGDQVDSISGYESNLEAVKSVVNNDPKLAAQVVKKWVGND